MSAASVSEGKMGTGVAANERHFLCPNDVRFVQMPTNEVRLRSEMHPRRAGPARLCHRPIPDLLSRPQEKT